MVVVVVVAIITSCEYSSSENVETFLIILDKNLVLYLEHLLVTYIHSPGEEDRTQHAGPVRAALREQSGKPRATGASKGWGALRFPQGDVIVLFE